MFVPNADFLNFVTEQISGNMCQSKHAQLFQEKEKLGQTQKGRNPNTGSMIKLETFIHPQEGN